MSTFSKSQHTNSVGFKSSRAEAQDTKKASPVPRSGTGRGARFKYLQSQPNLDLCITREIENAVGTAHRMVESTARHPSVQPEDQVELVRGDQVELVRGDQVELVRGTSRGWIPMEFREEARKKDPTILEDLAAPEEATSWGTGDGRNGNKSLVLSHCGRYWTADKRNTLGDFIPRVPKVKATGRFTRVSHDKEVDDKRETSSEMADWVYSRVPRAVCSPGSSFHSVVTASGDWEDEDGKYRI